MHLTEWPEHCRPDAVAHEVGQQAHAEQPHDEARGVRVARPEQQRARGGGHERRLVRRLVASDGKRLLERPGEVREDADKPATEQVGDSPLREVALLVLLDAQRDATQRRAAEVQCNLTRAAFSFRRSR
jgi:hypothetical protein